MRKFLSTKRLVKIASFVNFDFINNTSCVHEDSRHLSEILMYGVEYFMSQSEVKDNSRCPLITIGIVSSTKRKHKFYNKYLRVKSLPKYTKLIAISLLTFIRLSKQNYLSYFCQIKKKLTLRQFGKTII